MSLQSTFWEREHRTPQSITQLDQSKMASAVRKFHAWLRERNNTIQTGISVCCGKGRNEIGLAQVGIEMHGLDLSSTAINEAQNRAKLLSLPKPIHFIQHDVTKPWPFAENQFDIGLDSFALADIESPEARLFAAKEMTRTLRVGGYLLVYTLSTDDEYSAEMLRNSPLHERNTYSPPSGKFEKCFDQDELVDLYDDLWPVVFDRFEKTATYERKTYQCKHHWIIFTKTK